MTDAAALITAIFSAIATFFAAIAAWRAPITAARLAETLRRDAERRDETQRRKAAIFDTLMQERSQIYSVDAVRSLNSIDVVFCESRAVREAWALLFQSFSMTPYLQHVTEERLRGLLGAMARDIGLPDRLGADDFARVYKPGIRVQEEFIRDTQRQQLLQSLGKNAAAATAPQDSLWPPKPK